MDFSNLSRAKNRNNGKLNVGGTSASDFDPSETKQLKNPRESIEKSGSNFVPRVIDSDAFNFEGPPHEEEVSMISNFISKNKVTIGIIIILIIITIIVIYLWYYFSKKKNGVSMFNKGGTNNSTNTSSSSISSGINKTSDSIMSTLKIKKPVKISSLDNDLDKSEGNSFLSNTEDKLTDEVTTKATKKKSKSKSQKNEIQIPSRKEVIDKSKEVINKITKDTSESEEFMNNKREIDNKPKINLNFLQNDESDEESSKFYNNK